MLYNLSSRDVSYHTLYTLYRYNTAQSSRTVRRPCSCCYPGSIILSTLYTLYRYHAIQSRRTGTRPCSCRRAPRASCRGSPAPPPRTCWAPRFFRVLTACFLFLTAVFDHGRPLNLTMAGKSIGRGSPCLPCRDRCLRGRCLRGRHAAQASASLTAV
jgi:hypothetical protein